MTEKESRSFQIKTILLTVGITVAANIVLSAFGYYRDDTKSFDEKLEKKVNITDYNADKAETIKKDSKQADFNMEIKTTLTGIGANTQWLVDEYKRRNK